MYPSPSLQIPFRRDAMGRDAKKKKEKEKEREKVKETDKEKAWHAGIAGGNWRVGNQTKVPGAEWRAQ